METKIHYHSDCSFFAGCENMLVNFFSSQRLRNEFVLSFSYRFSEEYEKGLHSRIKELPKSFPLQLWSWPELSSTIRKNFPPLISLLLLGLLSLLLVRQIIFLQNVLTLHKLFIQIKPQTLHINNGGHPGAHSCMAAVIAGKWSRVSRIIYVVNNLAIDYSKPSRLPDWPIDRLVARWVTTFITGSKHASKRLQSVLSVPTHKLKNIPNGISPRKVTLSRDQYLDQVLPKIKDKVTLGIVAMLEKRKGHFYLLEAMKQLKEELPPEKMPHLLIEGTGELLASLQAQVSQNNIAEYVHFLGHQKNIYDLLNALDIFILPSISQEDFPNVILEAMSLGKPVVSTNLAGIPEQVEDGVTGFVVQPGNSQELAQKLSILLQSPEMRKKMGELGKQKFDQNYLSEISVSRYINLYKERTHD